MQLHQTAAQGLSLFLLVTVIQINLSLQLINKPYYSPGLHQFVNINFFPAEVHQDYFPKTLYFKCLTERKDINYQKMFLLIFHSATTSILT